MLTVANALTNRQRALWDENGFLLLKGAIDHELIDDLNADVAQFRATCGETKDEFGFGQRIGVFHVANENSLRVALDPGIVSAAAELMEDDPIVLGSLIFETGTQ